MEAGREGAEQPQDKGAVRLRLLSARRLMSPPELARTTVAIEAALGDLVRAAPRVASYAPLAGEPRPPTVDGAMLPVLLADGDLDWQCDGVLLGRDAVADADLVLVPAVAVDHRGARLGRGGGSYDRALRRAHGRTIALLHDGELVERLPIEPHDVAVGWAVTPTTGLVELPL